MNNEILTRYADQLAKKLDNRKITCHIPMVQQNSFVTETLAVYENNEHIIDITLNNDELDIPKYEILLKIQLLDDESVSVQYTLLKDYMIFDELDDIVEIVNADLNEITPHLMRYYTYGVYSCQSDVQLHHFPIEKYNISIKTI